MAEKYIIEVRDENGQLDFKAERIRREEHPYLFQQETYTIDQLCYYMSYGRGQGCLGRGAGPMELPAFMESIGISYRVKTW